MLVYREILRTCQMNHPQFKRLTLTYRVRKRLPRENRKKGVALICIWLACTSNAILYQESSISLAHFMKL